MVQGRFYKDKNRIYSALEDLAMKELQGGGGFHLKSQVGGG